MSVELFRDDDRGYASWLAANAHGCVLNIERSMNASDARVHEADCRTISSTPPRSRTWTRPYVKSCSTSLTELDALVLSHAGSAIIRCGIASPNPKRLCLHPHGALYRRLVAVNLAAVLLINCAQIIRFGVLTLETSRIGRIPAKAERGGCAAPEIPSGAVEGDLRNSMRPPRTVVSRTDSAA